MIKIKKGHTPAPLLALQNVEGASYDDLRGSDKDEVKSALLENQGYICAYCMKPINENTMGIEHFKSQSTDPHLDLDFNNMLAVCRDQNEHCDVYRSRQLDADGKQKNFVYLPNPKSLEFARLKFNYARASFEITCSNDDNVTQELEKSENLPPRNGLLNLNCKTLTDLRRSAWSAVQRRLERRSPARLWRETPAAIRLAEDIYREYQPSGKNKAFYPVVLLNLERHFPQLK
ncbi:retron system putative HNH endonuclease [Hugenholtzia roseola]|uniref:retron system putative HNH endonuclease n=1 Tax=Hugenholtzia roseola TaxID=1002 RepID=UPI000407F061|nr:retron system putative HNH endonuclease [Hugenholtzia roseola]